MEGNSCYKLNADAGGISTVNLCHCDLSPSGCPLKVAIFLCSLATGNSPPYGSIFVVATRKSPGQKLFYKNRHHPRVLNEEISP